MQKGKHSYISVKHTRIWVKTLEFTSFNTYMESTATQITIF